MNKFKVVQFPDNTYGAVTNGLFDKRYAANYKSRFTISSKDIDELYRYGRHSTLQEAQETVDWMNGEYNEFSI